MAVVPAELIGLYSSPDDELAATLVHFTPLVGTAAESRGANFRWKKIKAHPPPPRVPLDAHRLRLY